MMFYAIRHGETDQNNMGIVQGAGTNSSLNEKGKLQAEIVAERMADLGLTVIYSSDMIRSQQTTEIINQRLSLDVFYTSLLRETHYGEIEGMKSLDVDEDERYKHICLQVDDKNNPDRHDVCFPGAESRNVSVRRFIKCLGFIKYDGKPILLSTHGGILRSMSAIYGGPDEKIPNTGGLSFNLDRHGLPTEITLF